MSWFDTLCYRLLIHADNGEGDWGDFHIGYGGFCDNLYPPAGYWCSQNPPRGNCYNPNNRTSRGCVAVLDACRPSRASISFALTA